METMIASQREFVSLELELEDAYNEVAPWLILGKRELQDAAREIGKPSIADASRLLGATRLVDTLERIAVRLIVKEEPFDGPVLAGQMRLRELVGLLRGNLISLPDDSTGVSVANVLEAVGLARTHCGAQREALLNKLSRAYQKPEFCVRRDSVGPEADTLLARALAWDEDWYYGSDIDVNTNLPRGDTGSPMLRNLIPPRLPS
jgi:hypothetical protein